MRNFRTVLLIILLLYVAMVLRSARLSEFRPIEADERTWLMVGISLLETGTPTTWTLFHSPYQAAGIPVGRTVTPYLDHPPLFSLLAGGWLFALGERSMHLFDWQLARLPMIAIALLSILTTYLLARLWYGSQQAFFTLLAFVFFPSHIVSSRFVTPEHLIGLIVILALYCLTILVSASSVLQRNLMRWVLLALAFTAPLLKLSGVVVSALVAAFSIYHRRYRLGVMIILAVLLGLMLFGMYGYFYNWDAFLGIIDAHHSRSQSFAHFWRIFTQLDIGHFGMYDPSLIVGMVGVLALAATDTNRIQRTALLFTLLAFAYLFTYHANAAAFGWYRYSLYPLMALGLGYVFHQIFRGRYVYLVLFLPLLTMMFEHADFVEGSTARRLMITVMYVIIAVPVLSRDTSAWFRAMFLFLLGSLFVFETLWVLRILGIF